MISVDPGRSPPKKPGNFARVRRQDLSPEIGAMAASRCDTHTPLQGVSALSRSEEVALPERLVVGFFSENFQVFVLNALVQALHDRKPLSGGSLVCHSDRGSQFMLIKYPDRLAEAGFEPSIGSVGDRSTTLSQRRSTVSTNQR